MRLRRLLLPALVVPSLVGGLLAVPVLTLPVAAAEPVAPVVVEVPLAPAPALASRSSLRAAGSAAARTLVLTEQRDTRAFSVVGVTWDASPSVGQLAVQVRTRTGGTWSPWTPLETVPGQVAEGAEADGARLGTEPLWVGDADGVQARVDLLSGAAPTGVRLSLVDPGESPADGVAARTAAPAATAHAAAPSVRPRSAWGADESIRGGSPSYASRVRAVTLHHTASSSSYDRDDVPALLRGFYAYHVKSNGWSDLGYNFLVDRFGTVWEGRAGGTGRAVIGAHAGGFNTGTVGVSMIGTYESVTPSAAMLEGVAQVAGWKLGTAGVDPRSSTTLTSAGSTRYRSGTGVRLPAVFGHKDVSATSCPGTRGYAALPGLRERAAALAAGAVPELPAEEQVADTTLRVEAPSTARQGEEVPVVVRGLPGRPVQLWFAQADGAGATLRRSAELDADGAYRTTFPADGTHVLFAVSDERTSARVTVQAGSNGPAAGASALAVAGPVTAAPGSEVLLTVTGPAGSAVTLWFSTPGEPAFVRRRAGVLGPDGTWTTTYTAAAVQQVFAMSSTVTSADTTVLLGAVPNGLHVTVPDAVEAGAVVPVVVQGTPGAAVEVWFARADGPFTRRRDGVLAADGTFRTSFAGTDEHTVYAVAAGRTSTRVTTRVAGGAVLPTAPAEPAEPPVSTAAPAGADAGAPVELTVTGPPGAGVDVWFRSRSSEVFTKRRTGSFDAEGTYRTSYVGLDDEEYYATTGRSASRDAGTLLRPVVAAPASARLGAAVTLTGRARPGDTVLVEQRRRASGLVVRRTATAGANGAFRLAVPLADESDVRASVGDRTGTSWATTKVSPSLVAPSRTGRGSRTRLTGTARPGAVVEVLFRKRGARTFTVGRRLVADSSGRWTTTAVFGVAHRMYARADGLASPQVITDVR